MGNDWGQTPNPQLPSWLQEPLTPERPSTPMHMPWEQQPSSSIPQQADWGQVPFPPTQQAWTQPTGGNRPDPGQPQLPPLPVKQSLSSAPTQYAWGQSTGGNQSGWGQQPLSQPSQPSREQQTSLPPTQLPWGQPAGGNQPGWNQQTPLPPTQPAWGQPAGENQTGWNQQTPPPPPPLAQPLYSRPESYTLPGQFQSPQKPPKKKKNRLWVALGVFVGILVLCSVMINLATKNSDAASTEASYKSSTTPTTVINLDKDGNADQGKDVSFLCAILNFVKDSNGITAGANVRDPNSYSSVIQIAFPSGTDISQLNQGDILEIWGGDTGVFSGQNAFGVTIQEVEIDAKYLTDQTTNYQAGS